MGVTDRDGERIGGIGGGLDAGQQAADHHGDLALVGMARAGHRLLHEVGGVLEHREAGASRTTPRAWPSFSVDPGFTFTKVSSMAASSGHCASTTAATPSNSSHSRAASEPVVVTRTTPCAT